MKKNISEAVINQVHLERLNLQSTLREIHKPFVLMNGSIIHLTPGSAHELKKLYISLSLDDNPKVYAQLAGCGKVLKFQAGTVFMHNKDFKRLSTTDIEKIIALSTAFENALCIYFHNSILSTDNSKKHINKLKNIRNINYIDAKDYTLTLCYQRLFKTLGNKSNFPGRVNIDTLSLNEEVFCNELYNIPEWEITDDIRKIYRTEKRKISEKKKGDPIIESTDNMPNSIIMYTDDEDILSKGNKLVAPDSIIGNTLLKQAIEDLSIKYQDGNKGPVRFILLLELINAGEKGFKNQILLSKLIEARAFEELLNEECTDLYIELTESGYEIPNIPDELYLTGDKYFEDYQNLKSKDIYILHKDVKNDLKEWFLKNAV